MASFSNTSKFLVEILVWKRQNVVASSTPRATQYTLHQLGHQSPSVPLGIQNKHSVANLEMQTDDGDDDDDDDDIIDNDQDDQDDKDDKDDEEDEDDGDGEDGEDDEDDEDADDDEDDEDDNDDHDDHFFDPKTCSLSFNKGGGLLN